MELGSALIGAIFLLLCMLPFVMMSRSRKRREKMMLQSLSKIALDNNCQTSEHELFAHLAIGLDHTRPAVMFYRKIKENTSEQFVDLREIQSCKVFNTSRTVKTPSGERNVVDKLELGLIPIEKNKKEVRLKFFDSEENSQLFGELQSIQKWSKQLGELINSRK